MADNQDSSRLLLGRSSMLQRTLRGERVSSEERQRGRVPHVQLIEEEGRASLEHRPAASSSSSQQEQQQRQRTAVDRQ
eukprot:12916439-Prorocentrum_lima.AAC.1